MKRRNQSDSNPLYRACCEASEGFLRYSYSYSARKHAAS